MVRPVAELICSKDQGGPASGAAGPTSAARLALGRPARAPGPSSGPQDGQAATRKVAVNNPLTPNQTRPTVENPEYAAFVRRILRACARRIAVGDIESLASMAELGDTIDASIQAAVTGLRPWLLLGWDRLTTRRHPSGSPAAVGQPAVNLLHTARSPCPWRARSDSD